MKTQTKSRQACSQIESLATVLCGIGREFIHYRQAVSRLSEPGGWPCKNIRWAPSPYLLVECRWDSDGLWLTLFDDQHDELQPDDLAVMNLNAQFDVAKDIAETVWQHHKKRGASIVELCNALRKLAENLWYQTEQLRWFERRAA